MASRAERRDARENRERILGAAGPYLAERGLAAPLDGIARAAGVSRATVYRNFPERGDLIRALYDVLGDELDELTLVAEREPTGWGRIVAYVDGVLAMFVRHPWGSAIMAAMSAADPEYRPGRRWERPMEDAVALARAEGSLREDASPTDVAFIPHVLGSLARLPEPMRTAVMARQRAALLDGYRREAARTPMPSEPIDIEGFHRAAHTVLDA